MDFKIESEPTQSVSGVNNIPTFTSDVMNSANSTPNTPISASDIPIPTSFDISS